MRKFFCVIGLMLVGQVAKPLPEEDFLSITDHAGDSLDLEEIVEKLEQGCPWYREKVQEIKENISSYKEYFPTSIWWYMEHGGCDLMTAIEKSKEDLERSNCNTRFHHSDESSEEIAIRIHNDILKRRKISKLSSKLREKICTELGIKDHELAKNLIRHVDYWVRFSRPLMKLKKLLLPKRVLSHTEESLVHQLAKDLEEKSKKFENLCKNRKMYNMDIILGNQISMERLTQK